MTLTVTKVGDTDLRVTRSFRAPPERVFEAHVNPDILKTWLLGPEGWTMPECISDPVPGGRIRFTWTNAEEQSFSLNGEYVELDPPHRIVHTEAFEGDPPMPPARVVTEFKPDGIGTRMEMVIQYDSKDIRENMLASGMADGMETSYTRLDEAT